MKAPENLSEYMNLVAIETARMAWPGSMMRGKKQVLKKGAKQEVEQFFSTQFPMSDLWNDPQAIATQYGGWHRKQPKRLARFVRKYKGAKSNKMETVAAKLLDTFMHQLMKQPRLHCLRAVLHLPLDRRVFGALSNNQVQFDHMQDIANILRKKPYSIIRKEYERVQEVMLSLLAELRRRNGGSVDWSSRIELNWL